MQRRPQFSLLLPLLLLLTSCATNPFSTAQTVEQKGDALYGVYVIAKEQGAKILQDAAVPDAAKRPLAEAMVASAGPASNLQDMVAAFGSGNGSEAQIQAAITAAQPLINQLVAALIKVKPDQAPLAKQLEQVK
jgi:hypothetical protein